MHDQSHEDLAVLLSSGEAPEGTEATLASCPECRALLADLNWSSRVAARAAVLPTAALQAQVLAAAGAPVVGAAQSVWRRSLALAVLCAVVVAALRWQSPAARRGEDLDGELARVQLELEALAESIGREHSDFDDDIRVLQGDAASLRRQLGG